MKRFWIFHYDKNNFYRSKNDFYRSELKDVAPLCLTDAVK